MPNIEASIPLQNESDKPIVIWLEPIAESYTVLPNQKIKIHAVFDEETANLNFTIAPNNDGITIYVPGEISGYIDSYVTHNGLKVNPD